MRSLRHDALEKVVQGRLDLKQARAGLPMSPLPGALSQHDRYENGEKHDQRHR
jgi:hypothetical protein